jgi:hypothetical protein
MYIQMINSQVEEDDEISFLHVRVEVRKHNIT